MKLRTSIALVLCIGLAGCSTLDSQAMETSPSPVSSVASTGTNDYSPDNAPIPVPPVQGADNQQTQVPPAAPSLSSAPTIGQGIAYFLPRQSARVTAKRSEIDLDKTMKALSSAEIAANAAKDRVALLKVAVRATEDQIVAHGSNPLVLNLLVDRLAKDRKALDEAEKAVGEKEVALTAARNAVVIAAKRPVDNQAKQYKVVVGIELLAPAADTRFGFRLNPRHSVLRDDEHKISITPTGLLTSIDVVATDRTAEALVELATFAGAIANPAPFGRTTRGATCPQVIPDEISAEVDFADIDSVDELNAKLACIGVRATTRRHARLFAQTAHPGVGTTFKGVVHRTPVEVVVTIERCQVPSGQCVAESDWFPTQVFGLSLPQAGPISFLPQNAGAFVRTRYTSVFKDGVLITYDSNRPSEVANAAALPMRLIHGLADGASKIISLQTGRNNDYATFAGSQKALSDAEFERLKSDVNLRTGQFDARAQLSAAQLADLAARYREERIRACLTERAAQGLPLDACNSLP